MTDNKKKEKAPTEINGMPVDVRGRAKELRMFGFGRPHMRAFHLSWFGFLLAFQAWFAFASLMPSVRRTLKLTGDDIATSNIMSVTSTILVRVIIGPLCDYFGPRKCMAGLLTIGAIPTMCGAAVNDGIGLAASRFAIGVIGGVFVPCQMWTTIMFAPEVVGTANAIVGGWGNLGGGIQYLVIPEIYNGFFTGKKDHNKSDPVEAAEYHDADLAAWRAAIIMPGAFCAAIALCIWFFSDDFPPNYDENENLEVEGLDDDDEEGGAAVKPEDSTAIVEKDEKTAEVAADEANPAQVGITVPKRAKSKSVAPVLTNPEILPTVILMMMAYAACFGTELAVNNAIGLYYFDHFNASTPVECKDPKYFFAKGEKNADQEILFPSTNQYYTRDDCRLLDQAETGRVAFTFGAMNIFARALGGAISDRVNKSRGLVGRIVVLWLYLLLEGIVFILFASIDDLTGSIGMLMAFSLFVQGAEGATFAVVPYVDILNKGSVSGLVGAGGNLGGVAWSSVFKAIGEPTEGFRTVAFVIIGISCLMPIMKVQGQRVVTHLFKEPDQGKASKEVTAE
jgi:NNP family nitrate/nitrite transporter-like MFS transporter